MIRKATLSDIDIVESISKSVFESVWSRASIEAEFHKDYSHIFLYADDKTVLGYIIFWSIKDDSTLMLIATDKSYQRKGIAGKLIEFMLREYPSSRWFLEVEKENDVAISLYRRYGFKQLSEIKSYYGIGLDALRMGRFESDLVNSK